MISVIICISLAQVLFTVIAAVFLLNGMQALKQQVKHMTAAYDDLKAAVLAQTTVDASAVTLIQGIADKLANMPAGTSDADLKSLADQLRAGAAPLAAAVTANTSAAPAA